MKKTKFYPIHEKTGAKLVDFAGYRMPLQYSSIIAEHKAVRENVGVFDVSHMGEIFIEGEEALNLVQHITINDASRLFPGRVQYSAMCYHDGGIVDDLLVYMLSENSFMLVVNASNIQKDFEWIKNNNKFNAVVSDQSDEYSLLAVQGPYSLDTLKNIFEDDISVIEYYHFMKTSVSGIDILISRTGYTGEPGYEIYFKGDEKDAEKIWNRIFEEGRKFNIKPVGLGARDTLRLEMGFCLYGNDIDKTTNPLEAGLGWITKINKGDFIGRETLLKIKETGITRKLCALISEEKFFPRHGYDINLNGKKIGFVTSGTLSPVLDKPIALGYVNIENSAEGNKVNIQVRNKEFPCSIVKLPFVKK